MKLAAPFKYQLRDMIRSTGIYYLVIVLILALSLLSVVTIRFSGGTASMPFNFISGWFLFVIGLCTFKEYFLYFVQNGVSRRSFFVSKLLAMGTLCILVALVDSLLALLCTRLFPWGDFQFAFFAGAFQEGAAGYLLELGYTVCQNLLVFAAGSFITVLYYRLNKVGKLIVSIGVPALLLFGLPVLMVGTASGGSTILHTLVNWVADALIWVFNDPGRVCLLLLVLTAILLVCTWLLQRRAAVKSR